MQKTPYYIVVAHFDHLTREGQSSSDAKFVEDYCKKNEIPFHLEHMTYDNAFNNFQNEARNQRYAFFENLGFDKILTAHHKDDVLESILLNIFRGKSLNAIQENTGNIYRPLLIFSKNEILEYAHSNKVQYVEDKSNFENNYDRNFVRNEVIPKLSGKFDNFEDRILNLSQFVNQKSSTLGFLSNHIINPTQTRSSITISKEKFDFIEDHNHKVQVIYHCIKPWGFNMDQCSQIILSLSSVGATFKSESHELLIDRESIIIKENTEQDESKKTISLANKHQKLTWGSYELEFEKNYDGDVHFRPETAYIDQSRLSGNLKLRSWQEGDYFYPLNMNHQKQSLKKFFVNNKVDRFTKQAIPILTTEDNQIIWIVGKRLDDRFKVTPDTTSILMVSILRNS